MKRVVIIQARMTSTRLPGKILMNLGDRPLLAHQIERLRRCNHVDEVCIATTELPTDDVVVELAVAQGVSWFRGDEVDVLSRYVGAAHETQAELVVRITSDCPFIDPEITDQVIACATDPAAPCDYASNTSPRTFPRGLDTEAFHADVLRRVDRLAHSPSSREHVTWFIHSERPDLFLQRKVTGPRDDSDLRWTVDTAEDLAMARALYTAARLDVEHVSTAGLVAVARAHPEIISINGAIQQRC